MNTVSCLVSQGKFQGLDLNEELYVGGYPNYTLLAKTAGLKTGFVGKRSLFVHFQPEQLVQHKCPILQGTVDKHL